MQEHDLSYVRAEMINAQAAPSRERGLVRWLRVNLFATPFDTVLTLLGILLVAYTLPPSSQTAGPARAGLSSTPSSSSSCTAATRLASAGAST
jgi:hypothetical protein